MASLLFVWRRAAGSVMFWWAPAALVKFGENPCHIQLPHQLLSPCSLLIPSNKTSNKLTLENSCLNESKLHRSSNDTQHSEIILHCIWTQVSSPKEYMRFKRQLSNGGAAWTEEYGDGIGRCSTAQGFYQNWKPNESCCLELMKVVTLTEQKDSPSVVKHEKRNPGTKKMLTRSWVGKMKNWRPSSMSWSTCHLNIWNHLEYLDNVEVTVFVGVFFFSPGTTFPLGMQKEVQWNNSVMHDVQWIIGLNEWLDHKSGSILENTKWREGWHECYWEPRFCNSLGNVDWKSLWRTSDLNMEAGVQDDLRTHIVFASVIIY